MVRCVAPAILAASLAASLVACSSDTAILLRITRDDSVPATVPRIHVGIGVRAATDVLAPASTDAANVMDTTYVDDTAVDELVDTSAVDLKTAPYEVMLRPSQALAIDTGLEAVAVGFDGGGTDKSVIAFGALGHEMHFHKGDTLIYEVTLSAVASPTADPGRRECGTLVGAGASIFACKRGCVRFDGDSGPIWVGAHDDIDCDGDPHGTDCDDYDWTVNHMATDLCNNGKNDDCEGGVDDGVDRDGDGFTPCEGDCVDNPAVAGSKTIHPGALENPHNGVDDNCSGACDEIDDVDGDTYTRSGFRTTSPSAIDRSCAAATPDCNDLVAAINPGAQEIDGNGFDDDCDGTCDADADGDGFTVGDGKNGVQEPPAAGTAQCLPAVADCDDDPADVRNGTAAAQIHPGAVELCDGVDDNCNGKCDEGLDTDGDHFTVCGTVNDGGNQCTWVGAATCPGNGAACDCAEGQASIFPASLGRELCDGFDESCDGVLFPMDSPCFGVDTQSVCRVGSRTCDDTVAGGLFSTCALTATPAPPEACSAFAACANDPDPAACVARALGNATRLTCQAQLDKTMTPPPLCPVPPSSYVVLLPAANGTTTCGAVDWILIGGTQHGAWQVGLTDPAQGTTPSAMVSGQCQANLVITQVGGIHGSDQAPPGTTLLILARRGVQSNVVVVDLTGDLGGGACPTGSALQCVSPG